MAKVVLRPGYAYVDRDGRFRAAGTITLVTETTLRVVADTGGVTERRLSLAPVASKCRTC